MGRVRHRLGGDKAFLWTALALLLTLMFCTENYGPSGTLYNYPAPAQAAWIRTSDVRQYTGCFSKDVELTSEVRQAWIGVISNGGFEVLCNGNPVGAQTYWRPTRIFQNGLTEPGQRVLRREPIVAYNFPREYQWSGHNNTKILTLFDLRPYLKKGKNSLCIEAEGRIAQPEVMAFGSILTRNGEVTPIATNPSWYAEPVPLGLAHNDWAKPHYSTAHWSKAELGRTARRDFLSTVPVGVFEKTFSGEWVLNETADSTFEVTFSVEDTSGGFLRVAIYSDFWLWLNGRRVDVSGVTGTYNSGEWDINWAGRRPLAIPPVLLDPDEVGGFFAGERFEDPRHGDPTMNDFKRYQNTQNRTRERPKQTGGDLMSDGDEERGREQDPYGFYEEADGALPLALVRKGDGAQLHAYDLSDLLEEGENTLRLRMVEQPVAAGRRGSQAPKFAVDGFVQQQGEVKPILSDAQWLVVGQGLAQTGYQIQPSDLPHLEFYPTSSTASGGWPMLGAVLAILVIAKLLTSWRGSIARFSIVYCSVLGMFALLAFSMAERSEYLWFLECNRGVLLALVSALVTAWINTGKYGGAGKRTNKSTTALVSLLTLVFLSRAWMVHFQPIDDDEYASIQAVLAIAETGVPSLAGEVWYSRSPLYHYIAAGVVKIFGENIWSLRLYSVVLSVLTAWVLWTIGSRYFREKWISYASVLIFALHPFLIFSGHIARFYQQQQLMVLLMILLFIEGFVERRGIWYRAGAILLFACAVLSQEISVTFVPVFLVIYVLFGKGVPLKWDIKAILYLLIAVMLVASDILLFKVKCLTDPVGVSPNVEATVAPTFWELGNLTAMFIGYSRLHFLLGIFYVVSLVYSIRRGASAAITLHAFLLVSVVTFNFLITSVSFRYMYSVIPLWILLGVHGVRVFSTWLAAQSLFRYRKPLCWVILFIVIISMSPWRILGSYREKILGDPVSALAYVRGEMRNDDKVMITEPHPHAAMLELGRVDYDLVVPILYDFTYRSDGVLRDRNGNAEVVNRLADLQEIFSNEQRVWIIINREKFRSRKKNIRWEYPGAREELFIRENCALKYRSYLWAVYLWDQSSGKFETFRKEPNSWSE